MPRRAGTEARPPESVQFGARPELALIKSMHYQMKTRKASTVTWRLLGGGSPAFVACWRKSPRWLRLPEITGARFENSGKISGRRNSPEFGGGIRGLFFLSLPLDGQSVALLPLSPSTRNAPSSSPSPLPPLGEGPASSPSPLTGRVGVGCLGAPCRRRGTTDSAQTWRKSHSDPEYPISWHVWHCHPRRAGC
jgi:hypothetical protein